MRTPMFLLVGLLLLPIFLLIFAVPTVVAVFLKWRIQ
jgi:hypothetical protein